MFLAEKGVSIETVPVAINTQEHRSPEFVAKNPVSRVPVLELDDGRFLGETVPSAPGSKVSIRSRT